MCNHEAHCIGHAPETMYGMHTLTRPQTHHPSHTFPLDSSVNAKETSKKNEMSLKPNPDAYSPSHITEPEIHNHGLEKSGVSRMRTSICPTGLNFGSVGLVYIFSEHPAKKRVGVKELVQGLKCLHTASLGLTLGTTYTPLSTARNNP